MKNKFLFILLFWCSISIYAQDSPQVKMINQELKEYSMVFESSVTKSQKFLNAKEWIAKNFGDYQSVVKLDDEPSGKIIGKGFSNLPSLKENSGRLEMLTSFKLNYTFTIDCREEKFRIKFEDLIIEQNIKCLNHNFPENKSKHDIPFYFEQIKNNKGVNSATHVLIELENELKKLFEEIANAINIEDDF